MGASDWQMNTHNFLEVGKNTQLPKQKTAQYPIKKVTVNGLSCIN